MTAPTVCHPPVDWSCLYDDEVLAGLDAGTLEYAEALGWITFATLTGYRVGLCPIQIRPCRDRPNPGSYLSSTVLGPGQGWMAPGVGPFLPLLAGGNWYNVTCGCRGGGCGCTTAQTVTLPAGVGGVTEVRIDGDVLSPAAYRVDRGTKLVRIDGLSWPLCQDMSATIDEVGSFVVTYWPGAQPTSVDSRAVATLANEFLKACNGDSKCQLPKSVTSVVRNGVTYQIKTDMFNDGLTGIREVDILIRHYNPNLLKARPRIVSSDRRRAAVVTSR